MLVAAVRARSRRRARRRRGCADRAGAGRSRRRRAAARSRGRSARAAARRAGTTRGSGGRAPRRARSCATSAGVDAHLVRPGPLDVGADVGEQLEHRLDVADPRDVRQRAPARARAAQAARIGSAPFLLPAARTVPDERLAALDDEGLASRSSLDERSTSSGGIASPRWWNVTREQAWETLTRYTKSESLLRHALAVEASTRCYARQFGEDEELWGVDRAPARLRLRDPPDARQAPAGRRADPPRGGLSRRSVIEAVLSHAEHLAMPRDTPLKKTLFACDELSGLRPRLRARAADRAREARAEVGAEEAEAAVVRGRRAPRRGLRGRRAARARARRAHRERDRGAAADRGASSGSARGADAA